MISAASQKLLNHPQAVCNMVRRIAVEAGDHILQYYDESGSQSEQKDDGSPVTIADRESEAIILRGLIAMMPDVPVVAEESVASGQIPDLAGQDWFWLVDPLDGTKEFIKGSPDFTVNIALIHRGQPVIGVVYVPVPGELYAGCGPGTATRWLAETEHEKPITVRDLPARGLTVMESKNHRIDADQDRFLESFKVDKRLRRGSSLKICMIAAGRADLYPRLGPTCEWDSAAGDAVLRSAGGMITDLDGAPMTYGHAERKFLNPYFVASSGFWPVKEE